MDKVLRVERHARCHCGKTRPSSEREHLPFFEERGPGSQTSKMRCRNCTYNIAAHTPETMKRNRSLICTNFEPLTEGLEFDSYYCGCRGWD